MLKFNDNDSQFRAEAEAEIRIRIRISNISEISQKNLTDAAAIKHE